MVQYFVGINILKHEQTLEYLEVIRGVLKLVVQDTVNYFISMAISILGILGLWVFWVWVF